MGFFSKFEGRMEDTFEGMADRVGNSPISPVQIAKKAERQMRREKMVGAGKQYAPTLYTVLVNPDDDHRLFGYYPTLAGETETYLAAKAAEQGLVMDGQPLVRFIVDDTLKHGKFEIIAETVAAPIIAQLRMEEMARYGMAGNSAGFGGGMGGVAPLPYAAGPGMPQARPQRAVAPQHQSQPFNQPHVSGSATPQNIDPYGQNAYPDARGQEAFYADPYANNQVHTGDAPSFNNEFGAAGAAYADASMDAPYHQSPQFHDINPGGFGYEEGMPLPDVPENEIDRSIDYGEYTFNSQNFVEGQNNAEFDGAGLQKGQPWGAACAPLGAASEAPSVPFNQTQQPANNTVMFTGQPNGYQGGNSGGAAQLFNQTEQRTCNLTKTPVSIGRESKNDITLHDINASRTHAELRLEQSGIWVISDLGSTNGTYVNGRRVASQPLFNGDRIDIGTTTLVFHQA